MRIISGKYRGKKLFSPKDDSIRPTSDRAREAVFSSLLSKLDQPWEDISLLELFSGTGSFSLEAISRGAKEVCLMDIDVTLSSKNSELFPTEKSKITIIKSNVLKMPIASKKYNLLFMDAPYNKSYNEKTLLEVLNKGWLEPNALCVVEVDRKEELTIPSSFSIIDDRAYGVSRFIFLVLK